MEKSWRSSSKRNPNSVSSTRSSASAASRSARSTSSARAERPLEIGAAAPPRRRPPGPASTRLPRTPAAWTPCASSPGAGSSNSCSSTLMTDRRSRISTTRVFHARAGGRPPAQLRRAGAPVLSAGPAGCRRPLSSREPLRPPRRRDRRGPRGLRGRMGRSPVRRRSRAAPHEASPGSPARLPLSTVEIYAGGSGASVRVSYQL